jgi:predicted acylesterase/phospholipase RssA
MTESEPSPAATAAAQALPYSCDLILKGGITSGIVYPPAIVEIARDHRFHSIGGASAGAIAAASAAAAELGRQSRSGGFERLAQVPDELARTDAQGATRLRRLFQPQPETRELFELIWLALRGRGKERVNRIVDRVSRGAGAPASWMRLGLAAWVVAVALGVAAFVLAGAGSLLASVPLVLLVTAAWLAAARVGRIYTGAQTLAASAPDAVAANFHGLCSGATPEGAPDTALTDWLYDTLQALAGRGDDDVPGALRDVPVTYGELAAADVRLVTITTDLSHGSSERFPLRSRGWAFDPTELRSLFPAAVVEHLAGHAAEPDDAAQRAALDRDGLTLLPDSGDLPIVMGARFSLSFPILLSAVPLYAWRPRRTDEGGWEMAFQKCWFSDGGITSNLPVHLFDQPLPTRPTYAINLGGGADPKATAWENVWRPIQTGSGRQPSAGAITSTAGLLSAVFDTMQNWADNSLARAPGQRDRICKVRLGPGEGGMNLDMPPEAIEQLAERGRAAGMNLAWMQRGARPAGVPTDKIPPEIASRQWDRHRFARYRTFLAGLGRYVDRAREGATKDCAGRPSYAQLADAAVGETWLPYRDGWSRPRRTKVGEAQAQLFALDTGAMTATPPAGAALGYNAHGPDEPKDATPAAD